MGYPAPKSMNASWKKQYDGTVQIDIAGRGFHKSLRIGDVIAIRAVCWENRDADRVIDVLKVVFIYIDYIKAKSTRGNVVDVEQELCRLAYIYGKGYSIFCEKADEYSEQKLLDCVDHGDEILREQEMLKQKKLEELLMN